MLYHQALYIHTWSVNSMMVVVTSEPLGCVSTLMSVLRGAGVGATTSLASLLTGRGGSWVSSIASLLDAGIEATSPAPFLALSAVRGAFLGTNGLKSRVVA